MSGDYIEGDPMSNVHTGCITVRLNIADVEEYLSDWDPKYRDVIKMLYELNEERYDEVTFNIFTDLGTEIIDVLGKIVNHEELTEEDLEILYSSGIMEVAYFVVYDW